MAKGRFDEVVDLETFVYELVGAASVCWNDLEHAGVFDDELARETAEDGLKWLRRYMDNES